MLWIEVSSVTCQSDCEEPPKLINQVHFSLESQPIWFEGIKIELIRLVSHRGLNKYKRYWSNSPNH